MPRRRWTLLYPGLDSASLGCAAGWSSPAASCVRRQGVGDEGVCVIAASCPLELLSLHGLTNVTDRSRAALVEHCAPRLHSIDVRGCVNLPQKAPAELLEVLPRLRTFMIHPG